MRFDPSPIHFSDRYNNRPYDARVHNRAGHERHVEQLASKTVAAVKADRRVRVVKFLTAIPGLTSAECTAMREAFVQRLPYLSPDLHMPKETTVESLLAKRIMSVGEVRFGNVTLSPEDAQIFERLQHELAGIHEAIAARQLYQLMHGATPTHIVFSEHGISNADRLQVGGTLIHVNTRMTGLDPLHGTVVPLSIILGHEIEHANVPLQLLISNARVDDRHHSNLEEVRVIDGYESAMLAALQCSARSTHKSHVLPIDEAGAPGIPYRIGDAQTFLRPGNELRGKLVDVNERYVILQLHDGTQVKLETVMLFMTQHGLLNIERHGFANPNSVLELLQERIAANKAALKPPIEIPDSLGAEAGYSIGKAQEQGIRCDPEFQAKLKEWEAGASRGDMLTVSFNDHNIINVHRINNDPDPIGTMLAKRKALHDRNMRNRWILAITIATALGITGTTAYLVSRSKTKNS